MEKILNSYINNDEIEILKNFLIKASKFKIK